MKTQKFLMAFAAIAALSLGSCTQEEELLVSDNSSLSALNDPNAVQFSTYTSKAPLSRAGVIDTDAMKNKDYSGFGVYAYYTQQANFATDGTNNYVPNFMCNQNVKWDNSKKYPANDGDNVTAGMWTYSPVKYWPNNLDEKVSFFAYAPYTTTASTTTGITYLPDNTTAGDPKIGYTISEKPGDQLDLLYSGEKLNLIKENIDQKVQFDFNHAMTRIGFERVIEVDEVDKDDNGNHDNQGNAIYALDANSKVTITSVSISSTEFYKYGNLNLRTGEWGGLTKKQQTYELTSSDFTDDGMNVTSKNSTAKTKLNNEDKYLMIFPTGDNKIPVEITVEYDVITEDSSLPDGKSQITSKITTPFEFAFGQGKYYNFVLRIGLTSVKLDVATQGWNQKWDSTDTEVVVNTPYNNTVCLIYDANGGKFANGSDQYIVTSYVNNWIKENNEEGEDSEISVASEEGEGSEAGEVSETVDYEPDKYAKFVVEDYKQLGIKYAGTEYHEFGGWTDTRIGNDETESKAILDNITRYSAGASIFVEKTSTSASKTIYALWVEPENVD